MFDKVFVFLPVVIIFVLLAIALYIWMNRDLIELQVEAEEEENEDPTAESSNVKLHGAKKARRLEKKEAYKQYKKQMIQQQKEELKRQGMVVNEKRHQESKMSPIDQKWFNEQQEAKKLIEIKQDCKADMNDVVQYIQHNEIVYLEELEILFFYDFQELEKLIDIWILSGVILGSRDGNCVRLMS